MPKLVPQDMKSLNTINLQPDKMSSRIEAIMYMELAGKSGKDIAEILDIGQVRVSIIRNSPLYMSNLARLKDELKDKYMDKQTDKLTSGDPVEEALKGAALDAAQTKIDLMHNSGNEFIRASASSDILDRAGYKSYTEKTKVTVEVTEKMSERWERALKYEPNNHDRETTVSIKREVSS